MSRIAFWKRLDPNSENRAWGAAGVGGVKPRGRSESSLQSGGPAASMLLVSPSFKGTVVEIMAQPGESVEAGTPLLRISRPDRPALPG